MCNLYSLRKGQAAIIGLSRAMSDHTGNLPPMPAIFPDYPAPIVRTSPDGRRELAMARWGLPSSKKALFDTATKRAEKLRAKGQDVDFAELLRLEPDRGTTNVRNTASAHWRPYLGVASRCLVPFTSFSEPDQNCERTGRPIWFGLGADEPLVFFAGIWTAHACVRKVKSGWEEFEAFGFLTTDSAEPVAAYHRKAMPVILTTEADREMWLTAPWEEAKALQRPLAGLQTVPAPRGEDDAD